jgi:O-antigen ligase
VRAYIDWLWCPVNLDSTTNQIGNHWQRFNSVSSQEKFRLVGFILVLVYAFAWLPFLGVSRVAESLFTILFIGAVFTPHGRKIRQDPLFWLMLVFLAYLILTGFWLSLDLPEGIESRIKAKRYYYKAFALFMVSFWIGARKNGGWILLAAFIAGVLFYLASTTPASEWIAGWNGQRVDFGILNAQHTGLIFGTMLLCLLFFSPRLFTATPLVLKPVFVMILILLAGLALFGVLVTKVRAVWLGLGAALMTLAVLSSFLLFFNHALRSSWSKFVFISFLLTSLTLIAGLCVFDMEERIFPRLLEERSEIAHVIEHQTSKGIGMSSVGVRIASWEAAIDWIGERPWLGWGPGTAGHLINRSPRFSDEFKGSFGHLHNSYLETLLSFGLIGTSILGALVVWVGIATVLAFRRGWMPVDVFIFAWVFFAFWMVVNIFESYIIFRTGFYHHSIIGGFIYGFYLNGSGVISQNGR